MQAQLNLLNEQMSRPASWTQAAWSGKSSKDRAQELLTRKTQLSKKLADASASRAATPFTCSRPSPASPSTRSPFGASDVGKLEYMVPLPWWIRAIEKIPNAAIQMP
jgi:hypothetical protein